MIATTTAEDIILSIISLTVVALLWVGLALAKLSARIAVLEERTRKLVNGELPKG